MERKCCHRLAYSCNVKITDFNTSGTRPVFFLINMFIYLSISLCYFLHVISTFQQAFIQELLTRLEGVHKQDELQTEGVEHPTITHSHYRHDPYHFNNPHHHHFHHTRHQNQTLWLHTQATSRQVIFIRVCGLGEVEQFSMYVTGVMYKPCW